ncbi:hypothetical protein B0H16DRAFT_1510550 [Mycena metata]|uniref:AAA+ ATPase domain-containing protein n=1 Tax=Mycena metata TaxID=1033252 RepID=A0AAD7JZW5_9AGAR|nr:hypothetical protein B0H16DRAFT_1510550 [Mycena metata]
MTPDDAELAFLATATPTEQKTDTGSVLHHQLVTSPLLTYLALKNRAADFPSRGLLGTSAGERVYANTNAPSTTVICGVQGAGKSHTVSCILESALIQDSRIGQLPEPLSALVFHFDTQDSGRPCEAAFLSSPTVYTAGRVTLPHVTILCSPSNVSRRRRAYSALSQVRVEPLSLSEKDLTADRMLALMGCDDLERMPLYMHTALLIIRNMGIDAFSYIEFKRRIALEDLDAKQRAMIKLRLDLLDAFVRPGGAEVESYFTPGGMVLVDLTDPFLDGLTATVLFDIILGTFTQWETASGKLVVLDEAHKYLVNSDTARLTQSLTNTIRLQRHLATRIVIATQEPTVIPATILDLASTIICHRFSSPAWCAHLAKHVSAGSDSAAWHEEVMLLGTGDALVFSPAAVTATGEDGGVRLLGREHIKLRVRPRLTLDGGASLLAVRPSAPVSVASSSAPSFPLDDRETLLQTSPASQSGLSDFSSSVATAELTPTPSASEAVRSPTMSSPREILDHLEGDAWVLHVRPSAPASSGGSSAPPNGRAIRFGDTNSSVTPELNLAADMATAISPPTRSASSDAVSSRSARQVPARLKHLVGWLTRNGGASAPLKIGDARAALFWVGKKGYPGLSHTQWWNKMMEEAVEAGVVELTNMDGKAEEKTIRLLDRGPFSYVK